MRIGKKGFGRHTWTCPSKQAQKAWGSQVFNQRINSAGPTNAEPLTSATCDMATRTGVKALPGANDIFTMQKQSPAQGPTQPLVTDSTVSSPCSHVPPSPSMVSCHAPPPWNLKNDSVSNSHYLRVTCDPARQRNPCVGRPPDLRPAGKVSHFYCSHMLSSISLEVSISKGRGHQGHTLAPPSEILTCLKGEYPSPEDRTGH